MVNRIELLRKLVITRDNNFHNLICCFSSKHKEKVYNNKEKLLNDIEIISDLMNELKIELNNI